jgi:hypothetical protein
MTKVKLKLMDLNENGTLSETATLEIEQPGPGKGPTDGRHYTEVRVRVNVTRPMGQGAAEEAVRILEQAAKDARKALYDMVIK